MPNMFEPATAPTPEDGQTSDDETNEKRRVPNVLPRIMMEVCAAPRFKLCFAIRHRRGPVAS
jgi:hypothetical protein